MMFLTLPNCPGGGGPQSVPSRILVVLVHEANAGSTPGRECPCEDQYMWPLAGTSKPSSMTVYDGGIRSLCEGRALFPSEEQFVPGSVVTSLTGETDVAGGHPKIPDWSREAPLTFTRTI